MLLLARLPLLVGLVLCLAWSSTTTAWAHAQLLSTIPGENTILDAAPNQVTLTFNEPVSPLTLKLIGPDGRATDITRSATGGEQVSVQLPTSIASGTHVLSWRVVSTDGHPVGGSLVFSVGRVTGAAAIGTGDQAVAIALWSGKALLFISLFVGVGGALFGVVAPSPRGARRGAMVLSIIGVLLAPITLGLQGLDALAQPLSAAFGGDVWSAALSTSYGFTAIVVGAAFLAACGALSVTHDRTAAALGCFAGALGALSLALSGHASAAAPQWLSRPAVFLHIGGILFWVGALLPLWLLLRDPTEAAHRALASFSRGIPYAVVPLVLSGVTLAILQMGFPGPQWFSPYGFILAAKLVLLAALFTLAFWNRRWLTAPALGGDAGAVRRLRQSIGLELVIVIILLGLVAGWRFTPPPRALIQAPAPVLAADPLLLHLMDDSTMAMVTISPGQAGPVALDIAIMDFEGTPKTAQSVAVTISSATLGIEPIKHDADRSDHGWVVDSLTIPVAGEWEIELKARLSRFELVTLQTEVAIP